MPFIESEFPLPCSQQLTTVPVLSLMNPIHTLPTRFPNLRSIVILFPHLRLGLPNAVFRSSFPTKSEV